MKTLIKIFVLMSAGLLFSCTDTDEFLIEDYASPELKKAPIVNPARGLDQERFVTMKDLDLTIHYRIIGKGPIKMVFVPGGTNPLTVYSKQFDYFRDKARCIYIDLPGHGISDAPSPGNPLDPDEPGLHYTMELMAEAVYTIIKKEGFQSFVAVGFATGPRVWGMFERMYPGMIYKLVNLDGGFMPEDLQEWVKYFWDYPTDILANIQYYIDAENVNEPVGWIYPKLCFYSNPPNMEKVNWIYPNNTTYTYSGSGACIHWVFHEEINPIIWEFVKDRPGEKY